MRIEPTLDRWIIVRGNGKREGYFVMFVDSDKSSWCSEKTAWNAHKFPTIQDAQQAIDELRRRAKAKRGKL